MSKDRAKRLDQLRQAYESSILDEGTYRAAITALETEAQTQAQVTGSGAAAQAGSVAAGAEGAAVGRDVGGHVVIAKEGARVFIGEQPVEMSAVDRRSALGRYLQHVISRNRYLQLQGIRSGGRLVHIELDQIYVSLRATRRRVVDAEEVWLHREAGLAPGEARRGRERLGPTTETVTVSVNEALKEHRQLVVLGDPGSGKTTLLRYLALLYARDLAEGTTLVQTQKTLKAQGAQIHLRRHHRPRRTSSRTSNPSLKVSKICGDAQWE